MPRGVITLADLVPLALYCSLAGEFIDLEKNGQQMRVTRIAELRYIASDFGFTPSARTRLVVPQKPNDNDALEEERYFGS